MTWDTAEMTVDHDDDPVARKYEILGKLLVANAEGLAKMEREQGGTG